MPESYRYLKVGLSKINAIIGIDSKNETVKTVFCSNMEFCSGFNIRSSICPGYCQLIAEAKKYVSGDRELNVEVDELIHEAKKSSLSFETLISYN